MRQTKKIPLKEYWSLLVRYLRPQGWRVVGLTALLVGSTALQLINPQILRYFIDSAVGGGGDNGLWIAALLFIGVALVGQGLNLATAWLSETVGWTATNSLRADLAAHCLNLDMPFHNARTPGELIERVDGDITAMANFFAQFVLRVLGNLLLLVGVLGLVAREDWRIGLALLVFSLITVAWLGKVRNASVPLSQAEREATARLFGFLEERLAGLEDIRGNGANGYVMRRFYERLADLFRKGYRSWNALHLAWVSVNSLFVVGYVLMASAGGVLLTKGAITLGTVYLLLQYIDMLRNPFLQLTRQIEDLQKASAGLLRVQELSRIEPGIRDNGQTPLPDGPLSVQFERVSFGYNADQTVIKDLSFRLERGQVLGLLGRTGSGKTTTSRLLFRLYEANRGAVRLGDQAIQSVPMADLRRRVGLVTQEVQLFHASVRDNLTFFDPTISDQQIMDVIGELGLGEWYAALPKGLDTPLKAGGSGLSAGEAQLLAFVRVFLADPGLVILDEASSRLDPVTERLIERAVGKLLENRTGIIIAHRLATVQRADKIMILEDGRLAEYGRRIDLAGQPDSHFYGLLRTGLEEVLV